MIMEKDDKETDKKVADAGTAKPKKRRMPRWLRVSLKTVAWTVGSLVALTVLAMCLTVWILTPERLTPLAERLANENLRADVKIERMELTIWKTFPYMTIDVDGLSVRSRTLDKQKSTLPQGVDSLLDVGCMRAQFNLARLPLMEFEVKEIFVDSPKVNLVEVNDSLNNYMILPPSGKKEESTSAVVIKSLVLEHFDIVNNRGIRYRNLASGLDFTLHTDTLSLNFSDRQKHYGLSLAGRVKAVMPEQGIDQTVPFAFRGNVKWDITRPEDLEVTQFSANVADVPATVDASVKMSDKTVVNRLDLGVGPVVYRKVMAHVPAGYKKGLDEFDSDMQISMALKLTKPYTVDGKSLPTFSAQLTIPDCFVANTRHGARIDKLAADAKLDFDGKDPNKSQATLNKLLLNGFGISLNVSGSATEMVKDPSVKAKIQGSVDLARVLRLLPEKMPFNLSGLFTLNTDVKFHVSDFSVNTFHRIRVNGNATLSNVRYTVPADSLSMFVDRSVVRFGTDSKIKGQDNITRNMLMASVQVDSMIIADPHGSVTASDLKAGVGSVGQMSNLMDTTNITPLGGRITLGRFTMLSLPDSTRMRVNGMVANASVTRFQGLGRTPIFTFGIKADGIRYWDRMSMMSLRDGDILLTANKRVKKKNTRTESRIDSLQRLYPSLSRDSLMALYRRQRRQKREAEEQADTTYRADFALDGQWQRLVRNWDFSGNIVAGKGRLFTPYFPLRNTLRDVDITFDSQRLNVNNITYRVGKSDLQLAGVVDNIRSTLLGSRRKPLTLTLTAHSHMLDLNELMAAMYKGNSFANSVEQKASFSINADADDDHLQRAIESSAEQDADTLRYAILVPSNVVMDIHLMNDTTRYADFVLNHLHSSIGVKNGVLNLRDLSARSADGSLKLDLLYATANRNDIGLGLMLDLQDIKVGRLMKIMPELDSIMPMMKGVDGVINARLAATTKIDTLMNVILPSTSAALNISGKDLVLLDTETFRQLSKMLRFKDRNRNMIDSLSVEAVALNSQLDVYPFILRMDRYKLAVVGWNDFETNYKYHISVLDSPLPFKFGINLSGNIMQDKMKFRLGKAKLKEKEVAQSSSITETTKRNLFKQMDEIFRRGAEAGLREEHQHPGGPVPTDRGHRPAGFEAITDDDRLSAADSLQLIQSGLIDAPVDSSAVAQPARPSRKAMPLRQRRKNAPSSQNEAAVREKEALKPEN